MVLAAGVMVGKGDASGRSPANEGDGDGRFTASFKWNQAKTKAAAAQSTRISEITKRMEGGALARRYSGAVGVGKLLAELGHRARFLVR